MVVVVAGCGEWTPATGSGGAARLPALPNDQARPDLCAARTGCAQPMSERTVRDRPPSLRVRGGTARRHLAGRLQQEREGGALLYRRARMKHGVRHELRNVFKYLRQNWRRHRAPGSKVSAMAAVEPQARRPPASGVPRQTMCTVSEHPRPRAGREDSHQTRHRTRSRAIGAIDSRSPYQRGGARSRAEAELHDGCFGGTRSQTHTYCSTRHGTASARIDSCACVPTLTVQARRHLGSHFCCEPAHSASVTSVWQPVCRRRPQATG